MAIDATKIQLHLAQIASIYNRLVGVIPPDRWKSVAELPPEQKTIVGNYALALSNRIDVVRELLDESLLAAQIKISDTSQARQFFNEIQQKRDDLSDLWLESIGIGPLSLEDLGLGETVPKEEEPHFTPYHITDAASLFRWCVERVDDYLEDGGTNPDVIVENRVHDQALRIMDATFFQPDKWYGNLRQLSPLVLNTKKLPPVVQLRIRELYVCLIVGTPSAAAILARSTLEYVLLERASSYAVRSTESSGELKRLGTLVNEYSDAAPELEIDMRSVKRIGDQAVHAYIGHKNVVTIAACGIAEAFRSWAGLRDVLQRVYA